MNKQELKKYLDVNMGARLKSFLDQHPTGVTGYAEHLKVSRVTVNNRTKLDDMKVKDLLNDLVYFRTNLQEYLGLDSIEEILPEKYRDCPTLKEIWARLDAIESKISLKKV